MIQNSIRKFFDDPYEDRPSWNVWHQIQRDGYRLRHRRHVKYDPSPGPRQRYRRRECAEEAVDCPRPVKTCCYNRWMNVPKCIPWIPLTTRILHGGTTKLPTLVVPKTTTMVGRSHGFLPRLRRLVLYGRNDSGHHRQVSWKLLCLIMGTLRPRTTSWRPVDHRGDRRVFSFYYLFYLSIHLSFPKEE